MKACQAIESRSCRRRRLTPGLEPLEGRRLLATIAATIDAQSNPVIFSIGPGGTVSDDRQVPTNDPATPYRPNGLETLAGISATSVAAYQAADGSPVVLATTGPLSYVEANQYAATGNPTRPDAWTGWQPLGTFVARSVVAVGSTGGVGPAVFAIGADSNVYEDLFVGSGETGQFQGFQPLAGLAATSLAATFDGGDTFRVFALTGPESDVYEDTATNSGGTSGPGTLETSGWSSLGDFVADSISVAAGPVAALAGASSPDTRIVFATGAGDGHLYDDSLALDAQTGLRTGTGFQAIGLQAYGYDAAPALPFVASSATDSGGYLTVFALSATGAVSEDQYVLTGLTDPASYWLGWQPLDDLQGSEVASTPAEGGGVEVLTTDSTGVPEFAEAPAHAALSFPGYAPIANVFSAVATVSSSAYHQIVTTTGVNGRPAVFAIGSGGTVSVSQDLAPGTGVTTTQDPYSAFTPLHGLAATSIAATTEPDGIAVFALTGASSVVFEDQYRPTGNVAQPDAWTGWQPLGSFVATSIAAATGGDAPANGPTIFAIGLDGNVYSAGSTAPAMPSAGYGFASFATLGGLAAATISVRATDAGIVVAALTGPESDAYADLDTSGSWSGWQLTGDYVMSSVLATTSAGGGPAVAGISPFGYQAVSDDAASGWGGYQPLYFDSSLAAVSTSGYALLDGFAAVTWPTQAGVTYFDLIRPVAPTVFYKGVYSANSLADGTGTPGQSPLRVMPVNSLEAAPDSLQPSYYVGGTDGNIYVNQAVPTGNADDPYSYLGYVSMGVVPS